MAQKRAAVQAASSKARMQALHDGAQQYSVSESFTAGWVNVLLRQLWPTVIEAKGSEVAKKGLQKVLNKVLAGILSILEELACAAAFVCKSR